MRSTMFIGAKVADLPWRAKERRVVWASFDTPQPALVPPQRSCLLSQAHALTSIPGQVLPRGGHHVEKKDGLELAEKLWEHA
mgnify:CR=1 FL=1